MSTRAELYALLREYGFHRVEQTGGSHLRAYHRTLSRPVVVSSTPGEGRALANTEAVIRRQLGLTRRGAPARIGQRRVKSAPRPRRQAVIPPAEPVNVRREKELNALNCMMREIPWSLH
jgi:predicted RNA binding protein YcfA (HicA-like mRNA interferase family)